MSDVMDVIEIYFFNFKKCKFTYLPLYLKIIGLIICEL